MFVIEVKKINEKLTVIFLVFIYDSKFDGREEFQCFETKMPV